MCEKTQINAAGETDKNNLELQDLLWFNDAIFKATTLFLCPHCGKSEVCVHQSDDSKKADKATFQCINCGTVFTYYEYMKNIISNYLFQPFDSKGIAQFPFLPCSKCHDNSYDVIARICYLCGNENQRCDNCGKSLDFDDVSSINATGKCRECQNRQA